MKSTAIYGPPGTGKTTWMMNKVAEYMAKGYSPNDIMYLSFTRAAAAEVLRRMGVKSSDTVSTIHSACYRLLRLNGSSLVNYSKLLKFGQTIGMPFKGNTDDMHETMELGDIYLSLYSLARNKLDGNEVEYERSDRPGSWNEFQFFFESYDSWKKSNGLIDFTDMLEKYQQSPREHGCKVIFIDESQDLSPLQWEVIREVVNQPGVESVYFAGDDDQAIFEWAGADPHGMRSFEGDTDADRLILDKSWRIPFSVHEVVTGIANKIRDRVKKRYDPRDEEGEVEYSELFEPADQDSGFILCRTHSIKQKLEKSLIERRVPFRSGSGGLPGPFDCKAAKAIRAWHQYKDTKVLSAKGLETMIAAATDKVRADLLAGDKTSILSEDPHRVFRIPYLFQHYFADVDILSEPNLITNTIHSSKGQEADEVTVITDWTPRVEAGSVLKPDSELRVWYVAMSRAKHKLRISSLGEGGFSI